MKEVWKDIEGYEGLYQVSNYGRVKSLDRLIIYSDNRHAFYKGKILKPSCDGCGKGYLYVHITRKKIAKIHRLVAQAFLPNPKNLLEINHIDGNTKNNNLNNLEWISHKNNCLHYTYELGQHKAQYKMKKVVMIGFNNKIIKEFNSISNAVRWLKQNTNFKKATTTNICAVCKYKKDSSYGFKWNYKEELI